MSGDSLTDGACEIRPVLGDLTNQTKKRGFSLISNDLERKCVDGYGNDPKGSECGDSQFAKQVCLGVENLVREKCRDTSVRTIQEKAVLVLSERKTSGSSPNYSVSSSSVDANKPDETKKSDSLADDVEAVKCDATVQTVAVIANVSRCSCVSTVSVPMCSGPCDKGCDKEEKFTSDGLQNNSSNEELISCTFRSDDKGIGVGRLASSQCGFIEWSRLPKSQSSRPFELDKCSEQKDDGCADVNPDADLLKSCSCSFCLKAAYIWSDLHYQDIKGRLAGKLVEGERVYTILSQKEASILVQNSGGGKQIEGNSNQSAKLDPDLTGQWRSLFLNMEEILVRENSQLQAGLVEMKEMRDKSKMDLERATERPPDKH